jgi:uncharacterized membrane protein
MNSYELLLFVHIAGAIVWIGGGAIVQFFALRALRANDPRRTAELAADVEWIGTRVFVPASLVVFLAGVLLMLDGNWAWGRAWVLLALLLYVVTFAAGAGFFGPESGRISKLVESQGVESPEAQARIRRILVLSRLDLIVLFAIVYLMAVKPTLDDAGELLLGAAAIAVAAALVLRSYAATRAPLSEAAAD